MADINNYSPGSGRRIKEDGTVVNQTEMIEAIYNGFVVNKDAGVQLTGSNVESLTLFDAVALTNTGSHFSTDYGGSFKLDGQSDYILICRNTLDAVVDLRLYVDAFGASRQVEYQVDGTTNENRHKINSGDRRRIINKQNFTPLNAYGDSATNFRLLISAETTPSSGSISIQLVRRV